MQGKSSGSGSHSPAPSAGEDPRESELLRLLNTNNWLNGSRQYRHKALAQFILENNHYVREKFHSQAFLREQFFFALAGCELEPFKILIKFIAQSRILTQDLKGILTDIMNKNSSGYYDRQWNKSLFRSTLARYVVETDIIANALLCHSNLPSTDPEFVARVLLNKIEAPALFFKQIDSVRWHIVNFIKGLVEFLLPSFLFSFKNPPIPAEVLACIEEAPRDLASAKAEASSNAAKILITFNNFGWSKPKEDNEPIKDSPSTLKNGNRPSLAAKQLVAAVNDTIAQGDQTFLVPSAQGDVLPADDFEFQGQVLSPIRGVGSCSLLTEDELPSFVKGKKTLVF